MAAAWVPLDHLLLDRQEDASSAMAAVCAGSNPLALALCSRIDGCVHRVRAAWCSLCRQATDQPTN